MSNFVKDIKRFELDQKSFNKDGGNFIVTAEPFVPHP